MTTRAATHTLSVMSITPAHRAAKRAAESHADQVRWQGMEFPVCMKAEFAEEADDHKYVAERVNAAEASAWNLVHELKNAGMTGKAMQDAIDDAHEVSKEVRKSVWYWAPRYCECAKCAPIAAPVAAAAEDTLTVADLFGEAGADW